MIISSHTRMILLVTALVGCVLLLRSHNTSPGRLLKQQIRNLATVEEICDGLDPEDTFTSSERSQSESFIESLEALRGGNPLKTFIDEGRSNSELGSEYLVPLIPFAAGWIIGFAISFIGCMYCAINWCCMHVPCCKCFQGSICKCCKKPTKQNKMGMYMVMGTVFMAATFATSIAGMVFGGRFKEGGDKMFCVFADFADMTNRGDLDIDWIGMDQAIINLETINAELDTLINGLPDVDTDYTSLENLRDQYYQDVQDVYLTGNDREAQRGDPRETDLYEPDYVANIGPTTQEDSNTGVLSLEMEVKHETFVTQMDAMDVAVGEMKTGAEAFKTQFEAAEALGRDLQASSNDLVDSVGDSSSGSGSSTQTVEIVIQVFFAPTLVFSACAIVSIILIKFLNMKKFNYLLYVSFCGLGFFNIFTWLLTVLLFPLSVVFVEVCGITTDFFADPAFFNKTLDALAIGNGDFNAFAYECIHTDEGNINDYLGLTDQMAVFDDVFTILNATSDCWDVDRDTVNRSYYLAIQVDHVENVLSGVYADSDFTTTDLAELNTLVQDSCANDVDDTWVLNNVNCSTSATAWAQTDADDAFLGDETCIGFNEWDDKPGNPDNRYTATEYPSGCGQVDGQDYDDFVTNFIVSFSANRDDIETIYGDIDTDIKVAESTNYDYMEDQYDRCVVLSDINDQVSAIDTELNDDDVGLLPNSMCTWVGPKFEAVFDALCVGWISTIYQTAVCLACVSSFTLVGNLMIFCLAKRVNIKKEDEETVEPEKYAADDEKGDFD